MGIVQPRLVQVDQRRADAQAGSRSAVGEADVGLARLVQGVGVADVREHRRLKRAAALEGAEVLPRLRDFPAGEGVEEGEAATGDLLRGERGHRLDLGRPAGRAVALPQEGGLLSKDAVGVGGGAKEDRGGGHRALEHPVDLLLMAGAAGLLGHPQVPWIDEADEFGGLLEQARIGAFRVGRRGPAVGVQRLDVGPPLRLLVGRAAGIGPGRPDGGGVAAMALRAADLHRLRGVDRLDAGVAGEAAARQAVRLRPCRALPLQAFHGRRAGRLGGGEGHAERHGSGEGESGVRERGHRQDLLSTSGSGS